MQKIFIAGCGYIGERIARYCQEAGVDVTCMVRTPEHRDKLNAKGFTTVLSALDDPDTIPDLDLKGAVIFYLAPPPGGGITDTRARNFIGAGKASGTPAKIIYISATSVYSETSGGIVTEESPADPQSAMGKRRLDAENAFREYGNSNNVPVVILRVSGIYGPGRLPLMQVSQGQPLLREEESGASNRIHADDLAAICVAAAEKGKAGGIYNISDGHPSSMTSYFNACADLLGYPRQPQVTLEQARQVMSPLMLSYVTESRTVDSSRMLRELCTVLKYPTMQEGLQTCR